MHKFRFSFNIFGVRSRQEFVDECRQAEQFGYDEVFSADHLGMAAPFPVLIAAAEATRRMRVGTLVVNVPFWNPALLARDIATTDVLTDGRLDVGLGAGHMKWEFDAAGLTWTPFPARVAALQHAIRELRQYFEGKIEQPPPARPLPRPVQRAGFGGSGPPLLVGGTGDSVLRIGAQHAQILGVAGAYQVKGAPPGTFRLGTAEETDKKVAFARRCAGARAAVIEWHLLAQAVIITDDRRAAAQQLLAEERQDAERQDAERQDAERRDGESTSTGQERPMLTVEEALETPFLLIGTVDEIAAQLRRARERWGFSFITVHEPYMPTFAPVIERLSGE